MEDGVAKLIATAGRLCNRESLAQRRTDGRSSEVVPQRIWDKRAINAEMALRYATFNDDEQLIIDYDGNLETAVALREEEIHEADLSTGILEATSAAMRSLLTVFGEYSIHPAGIRALQLKLIC